MRKPHDKVAAHSRHSSSRHAERASYSILLSIHLDCEALTLDSPESGVSDMFKHCTQSFLAAPTDPGCKDTLQILRLVRLVVGSRSSECRNFESHACRYARDSPRSFFCRSLLLLIGCRLLVDCQSLGPFCPSELDCCACLPFSMQLSAKLWLSKLS